MGHARAVVQFELLDRSGRTGRPAEPLTCMRLRHVRPHSARDRVVNGRKPCRRAYRGVFRRNGSLRQLRPLLRLSPVQTSPPANKAPSGMSGQFITQQSPGQWRASKLVGVDVYGTDNAKIGDLREVLVNRDGAAEAVVIGVGGFLGIGEKDVAVPFMALEWASEPRPAATSTVLSPTAPCHPKGLCLARRVRNSASHDNTSYPDAAGNGAGRVAHGDSAAVAASRGTRIAPPCA